MDDEQLINEEKQSYPSSSNSELIPFNQSSSLDPIKATLSEKMKLAKTPQEMQSYLNLIKQREAQIEQRQYSDFQLSESKNQIKYDRKIAVYKEIIAVIFSITSIIVGIFTTHSIPLLAPLLIVLGLIKPLGYSIGEVVELFGGINDYRKSSQEKTTNQKNESSD